MICMRELRLVRGCMVRDTNNFLVTIRLHKRSILNPYVFTLVLDVLAKKHRYSQVVYFLQMI